MPFYYTAESGGVGSDITTSATPNTEQDDAFVAVQSGVNVALSYTIAIYAGGKSAGLTTISGIAFRVKKWTTTKSTGGNAMGGTSPAPYDIGEQGIGAAQIDIKFRAPTAITSGTGGPTYMGGFVCGATGPGGWISPNLDSYGRTLVGATSASIDLFSSSAQPSLPYEAQFIVQGVVL